MIIYKTTNLVNGKIYIGKDSHNDPNYLGSGKILKYAIKKYGRENFKKEILEYCNTNDHLNHREIVWIKYYNSTNREFGYNISTGSQGGDNITFNPNREEILKKYKISNKFKHYSWVGKHHSEKSKKKMGNSKHGNKYCLGRKYSDETKEKMSKAQKGIKYEEKYGLEKSDELKLKLSNRVISEETRKKISDANMGDNNASKRPEVRQTLSDKKKLNDMTKIICEFCGNSFTKPNYVKYHGIKCKKNDTGTRT